MLTIRFAATQPAVRDDVQAFPKANLTGTVVGNAARAHEVGALAQRLQPEVLRADRGLRSVRLPLDAPSSAVATAAPAHGTAG